MPDLPKKKVGIIACSGEELPEGTVTRLAALRVLEELRPADTVTICLPLFLAGGEGDRAFARFYPTIAVDGCVKRCAALATEKFSGKPTASVVVTELVKEGGIGKLEGLSRLNDAGCKAVDAAAMKVTQLVDETLGRKWSRRKGAFLEGFHTIAGNLDQGDASCSCVSPLPSTDLVINGRLVSLAGVPLIFQDFSDTGKAPSMSTAHELMEVVKLYNPLLEVNEEALVKALLGAYTAFWHGRGSDI